MLHDEQHFIVFGRQRVLRAQQFVQVQVIAVGHVAREIELRLFLVDDVFGALGALMRGLLAGGAARRADAGRLRQSGAPAGAAGRRARME